MFRRDFWAGVRIRTATRRTALSTSSMFQDPPRLWPPEALMVSVDGGVTFGVPVSPRTEPDGEDLVVVDVVVVPSVVVEVVSEDVVDDVVSDVVVSEVVVSEVVVSDVVVSEVVSDDVVDEVVVVVVPSQPWLIVRTNLSEFSNVPVQVT